MVIISTSQDKFDKRQIKCIGDNSSHPNKITSFKIQDKDDAHCKHVGTLSNFSIIISDILYPCAQSQSMDWRVIL